MGLLNLFNNTIEGTLQAGIGTAKVIASPITQIVGTDSDEHFEDATRNIADGLNKIGKCYAVKDK